VGKVDAQQVGEALTIVWFYRIEASARLLDRWRHRAIPNLPNHSYGKKRHIVQPIAKEYNDWMKCAKRRLHNNDQRYTLLKFNSSIGLNADVQIPVVESRKQSPPFH
jgi:hypothetical protein